MRDKRTPKDVCGEATYQDDFLILYPTYMVTGSFYISLFEGTLHVNNIYMWFKIGNITRALPVPFHWQTDFTPQRKVVSRLHNTVARFRTGVKFSPGHNNWGELSLGWLVPAWWYHVNKCWAMRGNRGEVTSGQESPRCHVNTPEECTPWKIVVDLFDRLL